MNTVTLTWSAHESRIVHVQKQVQPQTFPTTKSKLKLALVVVAADEEEQNIQKGKK